MPFYTVNNQKIHVIEAGHPNRQVALMIHGWSSSWYAMSPLIGLMSQRFRVLAIDLPGYSQSPKLPQRTTIEDYADVLAELIEQVADGPVVLVGHSMGGMTSLVIAEKYPALVERIVLICPTITGKLSTYINAVVFPITFMERFGLARLITAVEGVVVGITDRIMRPASFAERTGITEQDYSRPGAMPAV
ncbi:MAG: alpha/beta hydrolase [Chloroflexi bacterium]|nr:alpha/beta hydrolase [Chloroflexota bacterium]